MRGPCQAYGGAQTALPHHQALHSYLDEVEGSVIRGMGGLLAAARLPGDLKELWRAAA
jgi:hypothetical protein